LQSAGVTGTITATPASSNKVWTLQNVTGTIYQTGGTDVAVADGGTNKSAWTLYAIPYASGTTTIGEIAIGTAGQVLAVNVGADGYTWAAALSNPMNAVGDIIVGGVAGAPEKLADVAVGSYLRSGGVTTAPLWSTLILPNAATAYRLPVATSANTIGELVAVGATGQYLAGATAAIPAWATLNQAAVAGLTTTDSPQFAQLGINAASSAYRLINIGGTFDTGANSASALYVNPILAPGDTKNAYYGVFGGTISIPIGETCAAAYGWYIDQIIKSGLGTVTVAYGLYVRTPTTGTTNYCAYFEDPPTLGTLAGVLKGTAGVVSAITTTTSADYLGGDAAYHTLNQAAVAGLTTASSPTFAGATLTSHLLFSGAANRTIQHSVDDQSIYVNAGSVFTKGASIQFYGEDHASYPGDAYIIAGSSDRAALGSIVELAFRDAGTYRKLLTLTYAATPVGLLTGSFQCTTGFGCNSKTAQTAYASGGPVTPGAGAYGYSSAVNAAALATLVTNIRTALVNVGIMS
jgi:hypothetical protein